MLKWFEHLMVGVREEMERYEGVSSCNWWLNVIDIMCVFAFFGLFAFSPGRHCLSRHYSFIKPFSTSGLPWILLPGNGFTVPALPLAEAPCSLQSWDSQEPTFLLRPPSLSASLTSHLLSGSFCSAVLTFRSPVPLTPCRVRWPEPALWHPEFLSRIPPH